MYNGFAALIFDMDGTLVNSGQLHEMAWIETLNHYSIPIDRALMRSLAGVPTLGTVEILLDKFQVRTTTPAAEIHQFKERLVRDNVASLVKPTALLDIVQRYHGEKPMAVGTGAQTAEALHILELCGLDKYLTTVVGADQVANPKPAPDTFLRCAELLGVPAAHCVVFEDAKLGLEAATRAGMTVVDVQAELQIHNDYFL
ncbi:MAG: beta-phosphoglucomutase family hydrolase [Cellvibrionaceae bacterium]|nr:beta-phosphoglucomutase family hydrolase [Cellvibrionaceae bacterium]